jgi:hypothetical protein
MSNTKQAAPKNETALAARINAYLVRNGHSVSEETISEGIQFGGYLLTPAKIARFILATR